MPANYQVRLDLFEGPLDLLLYLVRRNEVGILDLPLSKVTAQFVGFLEVIEWIDLDLVGEFLVVASTLMEIKSREAIPEEPQAEPEAETIDDSRSGLIRRLLDYKRYRDAGQALEDKAADWQKRFPRLTDEQPHSGKDPAADFIREVELWDLVSALSRVIRRNVVERETKIRYDDVPMAVHVERIGERVRTEGRTAFTALFEGERVRVRIVSMFLAVLELIRHHGFRAEQPVDFGEIWILPPAAEAAQPDRRAA